jgi:hypothetical protein
MRQVVSKLTDRNEKREGRRVKGGIDGGMLSLIVSSCGLAVVVLTTVKPTKMMMN